MGYHYTKAALGGTFDRLHLGHEQLLQTALATAEKLVIGLTTQPMVEHKTWSSLIQPYAVRERQLKEYLERNLVLNRVTIIPLTDVFGTTLTDPSIDALVVTQHTFPGAEAINRKRLDLHKGSLPIIMADLIKDDGGHYISSTAIREGKINRRGRVYAKLFANDITLTPSQRRAMALVQGELLSKPHPLSNAPHIAVVGDITYGRFLELEYDFDYAIIDGHSQRKPVPIPNTWMPEITIAVTNPPGMITAAAALEVSKLPLARTGLAIVDGEEDLL